MNTNNSRRTAPPRRVLTVPPPPPVLTVPPPPPPVLTVPPPPLPVPTAAPLLALPPLRSLDAAAENALLASMTPLERRVYLSITHRLGELSDKGVIRLELQNTPAAALGAVAHALKRSDIVRELQIGSREFAQLPSVIAANTKMHSLVVSRESCDNASEVLTAALASHTFRCIGFQDCQDTPELAETIEEAVVVMANALADPKISGLEKLAIGDKSIAITPEGRASLAPVSIMPLMAALAQPVLTQTRLTGLSLAGLVVRDPLATSLALGEALRFRDCQLRHLELFVDHDASAIADALCLNTSLAYVQWDSGDLDPLCDALKVNSTVTVVDLLRCSRAAVAGGGRQRCLFTKAVADFAGLRTLRLPLEMLDDEELESLGCSLRQNRSIRGITIRKATSSSAVTFGNSSICTFAASLRDAAGLEKIEISSKWMDESLSLTEVASASGGVFHFGGDFESGATEFARTVEPKSENFTFVHVQYREREEKFRVPLGFTLTNLLIWVGERFSVSTSRVSLIRRDNNRTVVSSRSTDRIARRTLREQFGDENPVTLYVSRGDRAAFVAAWSRLRTECGLSAPTPTSTPTPVEILGEAPVEILDDVSAGAAKKRGANSAADGERSLKRARRESGSGATGGDDASASSSAVQEPAVAGPKSLLACIPLEVVQIMSAFVSQSGLVNLPTLSGASASKKLL